MIVIPAIDIKDSKVVRLHQGKFDEVTEYSEDPVAVAQKWEAEGAQRLHVVDLDGALSGKIQNFNIIAKITKSVKIPVQVGGGIRSKADIDGLFATGVSWAILGTKIVEDTGFLKTVLNAYGEKIIVSLDCSNGIVAQRGWTSVSSLKGTDFARSLEQAGLKCLVYTDIARDGTLKGPNIEGLKEILNTVKIDVIASGGISGIEDIKKLNALKSDQLIGAITGKAIYDGRLNLKEAVSLCSTKE